MSGLHEHQLQLDLALGRRLADDLCDWRRRGDAGYGGAGTLLAMLVRRGLDEGALPAAALLVLELDQRRLDRHDGEAPPA